MELFEYLDQSSIGSIEYPDMKVWHFVMHENRIKAIDFDDATTLEPLCPNATNNTINPAMPGSECIYQLPCVDNRCVGYNAKLNMIRFDQTFSHLLFPKEDCDHIPSLAHLVHELRRWRCTATKLKTELLTILSELGKVK